MKTLCFAVVQSSVLALLVGCGSTVIGGNDDGSTGGQAAGGGSSVGGGSPGSLAIALFEDELPGSGGGFGTGGYGTGGYGSAVSAVGTGVGGFGSTVGTGSGGFGSTVGTGSGGYGSTGSGPQTAVATTGSGAGGSNPTGYGTGGGNGGGNPDNLHVFIATYPQVCSDPYAFPACPQAGSQISFRFAPDQQNLGVYSLQELDGVSQETGSDGNGCWFGGGSFWDGTAEVLAIDADTLTVRLSGTHSFATNQDFDGTYVVDRCGGTPVVEDAVAMLRSQIPFDDGTGGSGSVVTVSTGGGPEANDLMLFIGSNGVSCSDPFTTDCDTNAWNVSIGLPPAYQAVGIYSLSDPALQSTFSVTFGDSEPGACSGGGGSYFDGDIEVLSIDASNVTFRLSNTGSLFSAANADGIYTAPRCF